MKKATKKEILEIKEKLVEKYKDAVTELNYKNLYELLVSVMLSAPVSYTHLTLPTNREV